MKRDRLWILLRIWHLRCNAEERAYRRFAEARERDRGALFTDAARADWRRAEAQMILAARKHEALLRRRSA